jgi:FkbM family methyltransferase
MSSAIVDLNTSIFEHQVYGRSVKFAILDAADDAYRDALRKHPPHQYFNQYFVARSKWKNRWPWRNKPLRIVDGGANVGTIAFPMAALGFSVLAIEILPENITSLIRGIIENKFQNVVVVPIALYEKPASIGIHGFSAYGAVDPTGASSNRCYADTLANVMLAYGFGDADIVKLDIEGAELAALTDIETITNANSKVEFIFESNSHTCALFGYSCQDLVARFEDLGFTCYYFGVNDLFPCSSKTIQPQIVEDILATRAPADEIINGLGYKILKRTQEDVINDLERQAFESDSIHFHQHVSRQIRLLDQNERRNPRIEKIITCLVSIDDDVIKFELDQAPGHLTLVE